MLDDVACQLEPVHLGHHVVQQHEGEWLTPSVSVLQSIERLASTFNRHHVHFPVAKHSGQDAAIGVVIVDDQHGNALQLAGFEMLLATWGRRGQSETSSERKHAALPRIAHHPDPPVHLAHKLRRDRQPQTCAAVPARG